MKQEEFKLTKPLNHLAVIMDGNGRWAKKRLLPRSAGHKEGCKRIIEIFNYCKEYNIKVFTLFAFSTENRNRPQDEISLLFGYLADFFNENIGFFMKEGVKVRHMGDASRLPLETQKILNEALEKTKNNDKYIFNICLNYGSQQEIVNACKKICNDVLDKKLDISTLNKDNFKSYLDSKDLPDVDLLIRTSGEVRLSNFLLYQIAYSELIFTKTYWPDFKRKQFIECLKEYENRNRRFGAIKE